MPTDQVTTGGRQVADPLLERLRLATVGTYDIAGELGRGGMAVVYVGRDLKLERTVAIKVMDPRLSLTHGMAERFLQEARIAARLQHPNVIVVHDVQQSEDLIFFVMGLIDGGSIDEFCRRPGPLPIDQVRWVLMQAARALAYAHSEGIVHRDVKPANILLNLKGEIILTDFGIAKAAGGDGLTKSGTQIGTPVYMSPEQFSGAPVGPASDQYALGVTAYQLLTGAPPFGGELYALIAAHGAKTPVHIRERRPDCPAFLANAVMRMLEKEPAQRWPSLDDLVDVLGANMPTDGGAVRKSVASIARELREERMHSVPALTAMTPVSPIPTNSAPRRPVASSAESVMLTISPPAATLFAGGVLELKASVSLENGDTLPGAGVRWSSSDPAIVTVTDGGTIRGVTPGTAMVRAAVGAAVMDAVIRVDPAPLARLVVNTPTLRVLVGDATEPVVTVFDVTGQRRSDVSLRWESDTPTVVEIDRTGVLRALAPGQCLVEVAAGTLRRTIEVTVERRPIALLRIRTDRRALELGEAVALTLEAFDDRGYPVAAPPARWTSDLPSAVHVDSMGTALAIAPGTATITAAVDDASDTIQLESTESPISSLAVQVADAALLVGDSTPITARATDAFGAERSLAGVQVRSSAPSVFTVDATQWTILAVGVGEAELLVSAQPPVAGAAIERRVTVRVSPRLAVRLEATPPVLDVAQGDEATIAVRVFDRRGREIPSAVVVWQSDAPSVAMAAPGGAVRGLTAGSALLQASCVNEDGTLVDVRVPVRVRGAAVATPLVVPVAVPVAAPPAEPAAERLPSATALFDQIEARSRAPVGRGEQRTTAASPSAPTAANRTPLFVGVAAVAVAVIGWVVWPAGANRVPVTAVALPSAPVEAPPVAGAELPPLAPAEPVPTTAAPAAEPTVANVKRGSRPVDRPPAIATSDRRSDTPAESTAVTVPVPPVSTPPVVAEPVAETPTAADVQREAERVVRDLRSARGAGTGLADFWKDGERHVVELAGVPQLLDERDGTAQVQFALRFSKMNSGGRPVSFTAQATLDLTKRNGQVGAGAARFSALAPSK
ncbi:MAG: protein kinase [Gemmatimonadota bacterium]|nr:protein kinase [Gemmatimonadota bacterium]